METTHVLNFACSDTLVKETKMTMENIQLPFVLVHIYYAVSCTFHIRALLCMIPKWPTRVNLSTLVSNLKPGSDLEFDKNKDQYALYISSH